MKAKIQKEYKRKIKLILKSELNVRNKINAINTLAVPIVTYNYAVTDWKIGEIQAIDKMTIKQCV